MRFTVSRVIPSRGDELSGGVEIPFFTIKISKGVSGPVTRAMMDEYGAIVNDQRPKYSRWLAGVY